MKLPPFAIAPLAALLLAVGTAGAAAQSPATGGGDASATETLTIPQPADRIGTPTETAPADDGGATASPDTPAAAAGDLAPTGTASAATGDPGSASVADPSAALTEDGRAELRRLVETLESETARGDLIADLRALLEATEAGAAEEADAPTAISSAAIGLLANNLALISQQISATVNLFADLPRLLEWAELQVTAATARQRWIDIGLGLVVSLGVGLVLQWIVAGALRPLQRRLTAGDHPQWGARLLRGAGTALLDALPILAFVLAGTVALGSLDPRLTTRVVVSAILNAVVVVGLVTLIARFVLQPKAPSLRLIALSDETTAYLYVWVRRLIRVAVVGIVIAETAIFIGLPQGLGTGLLTLVGLLVAVLAAIFVLQNRRPFRTALNELAERGERMGETGTAAGFRQGNRLLAMAIRRLADVWHIIALLYVTVGFGIWALRVEGGFRYLAVATIGTVLILVLARVVFVLASRGLQNLLAISDDLKAQNPGLEKRANRYLHSAEIGLRAVVTLLAVLAIGQVWGLQALSWVQTDIGRSVLEGLISVAVVLVGALFLWEMIDGAIQRRMRALEADAEAADSARLRTLLPLARSAIMVVMLVIVLLIVMSELGLDIAPLLAGAGVIGLAIGFGSQSLVRDVITGLFILVEDTVKVGDVVDLAGHVGVVEGLSIRSVRLRDLSGTVHTIPFGDVSSVLNLTKDFSFYVTDVGIAYRENVEDVMGVLKGLGDELYNDEAYGAAMLDTIEILGLDSFGDNAVNIKCRLKTLPGKQWMIGREFNRRLKAKFDELGIEIPFPHRTLYFGVDRDGKAPAAGLHLEAPALVDALRRDRRGPTAPANEAAPEIAGEPAAPRTPDSIDD